MIPQLPSMPSSRNDLEHSNQSNMIVESDEIEEVRAQSHAIPLPASHIQRTESELQLSEDQAIAEGRDRVMFHRLVSGIRTRSKMHFETQKHQLYQQQRNRIGNSCRTSHMQQPHVSQSYNDKHGAPQYAFHGNHQLPHRVPLDHENSTWTQTTQTLKSIYETRKRNVWTEDDNDYDETHRNRITPIASNGNMRSLSSEEYSTTPTVGDWAIGEDYDSTVSLQTSLHSHDMIDMSVLDDELVFEIDL